MADKRVFIEEYSGQPVQIYKSALSQASRISKTKNFTFWVKAKSFFVTVFLPQGYPHTVTSDYVEYQIWDTLQAFSSSLVGALATAAVLKGVGVGNQEATVLAASMTWLLKDGTGMIGRIIFAWAKGTELDSNCKKWRLVADVFNDLAFVIDITAPHFSGALFPVFCCFSSTLRAIVGVAGGATRTAVTRHQARRQNLADVAAKDGSQETLVNFISLIVSLIMLPAVNDSPTLVWFLATIFILFHIFANYKAVRALKFDTLNQKRLTICVRGFCDGIIPSVAKTNAEEPLFYRIGPMKHYGCSLSDTMKFENHKELSTMIEPHHGRWIARYVPSYEAAYISLRNDATFDDQLDAAFAIEYRVYHKSWPTLEDLDEFREEMSDCGWILDSHQLDFDEWRFREKAN
uniref:Uncharacterized protein n=1 Tax=Panagrolaimus sp. ES5 TaxID=591445 RepID=A0AC34G5X9_9BILA